MTLFEALLSNVLISSLIAALALTLAKAWRNAPVIHALWLVALIKLVTPPLVPVYCLPAGDPPLPDRVATLQHISADQSRQPIDRPFSSSPSFPIDLSGLSSSQQFDDRGEEAKNNAAIRPQMPIDEPLREIEPTNTAGSSAQHVSARALLTLLGTIWIAGSVLWYATTLSRVVRFRRALRLASSAPRAFTIKATDVSRRLGLSRVPTVRLLPGAVAPMIWVPGRQAYLLLPRELVKNMSPRQLDALLTHEIAHLRCRHHWVRRFELLVTGLYWWCPIVWIARRKLREFEEEICDAWVVNSMPGIAESYAHALLNTVDFLAGSKSSLPPTAVGISHFQFLKRRITMIMKNQGTAGLSLPAWLVLLAVLALALPLAPTSANPVGEGSAPTTEATWQDDDDDDEDRDEDEDEDIEEIIEEIVDELTSELEDVNEEIEDAIEEAKEGLQDGIADAPREVLAALARIDVSRIVDQAVRSAPRSVRMFVEEVDPAATIRDVLEDIDVDDVEVSEEQVADVRDRIASTIEEHVVQLVERSHSQIARAQEEIARGLAEAPPALRRAIAELDLEKVITEATEDASPVVKQFLSDVKIGQTVNQALRDRETPDEPQSRNQDRDRARNQERAREQARQARDRARQAAEQARQRAREQAQRQRVAEMLGRQQAVERERRERADVRESRERAEVRERDRADVRESRERAEVRERDRADARESRERAEVRDRDRADARESRERADTRERAEVRDRDRSDARESRDRAETRGRDRADAGANRDRADARQERDRARAAESRARAEARQRQSQERAESQARRARDQARQARERAESRGRTERRRDSDPEAATDRRQQLERQLEQLLEQVDILRRELRRMDDQDRDDGDRGDR